MSYTACQLWPDVLSAEAQIRFWLGSPEVPATKREATEAALPQMMGNRLRQCWLNLTLFLGRARMDAPKPTTADITAFCLELRQTGQVEVEEVLRIRRRLYQATLREFEWHKERLRAVCQARYDAQMYAAHEDQAA